jgi:hypothetical protein
VSITAITGHTLLKLVGGQVVDELSKTVWPAFTPHYRASAKVPAAAVFLPRAPRKVQIEKSTIPPTALIQP